MHWTIVCYQAFFPKRKEDANQIILIIINLERNKQWCQNVKNTLSNKGEFVSMSSNDYS